MADDQEAIYISKVVSRLRWTKFGFLILLITTSIAAVIVGALMGIWRLIWSPYDRRRNIRRWLNSEPNLIEDYELEKQEWGHFRIRIETRSGIDVIVHNINREVIRLYAVQEIDPGALATIEQHGDLRNDLLEIIEAVLSNMRGTYEYLNDEREPCSIDDLHSIAIEYRLYSDGFSQQEFMNTILEFNRAMEFVNRQVEQMAENLRDQS